MEHFLLYFEADLVWDLSLSHAELPSLPRLHEGKKTQTPF
jgi:hypothetical protein